MVLTTETLTAKPSLLGKASLNVNNPHESRVFWIFMDSSELCNKLKNIVYGASSLVTFCKPLLVVDLESTAAHSCIRVRTWCLSGALNFLPFCAFIMNW